MLKMPWPLLQLPQEVGLDFERIIEALEGFHGAHRRFERVGKSRVVVYDVLAHHPTELQPPLQAARYLGGGVVAIFSSFPALQPHQDSHGRSSPVPFRMQIWWGYHRYLCSAAGKTAAGSFR